ncbi:MAG: hypothetical protein FWD61_05380 [Phycisphaerales bacterium]|nr:hypothetical protein [Phycisphaerales bacterium]
MQTTFKPSSQIVNVPNIFMLCLFCLAPTLLSGCGDQSGNQGPHPSALIGKWSLEEVKPLHGGYEYDNQYILKETVLELLKDGAGTIGGDRISWKVESGRLEFKHVDYSVETHNGQSISRRYYNYGRGPWDYKISGSMLTITNQDVNIIFKKAEFEAKRAVAADTTTIDARKETQEARKEIETLNAKVQLSETGLQARIGAIAAKEAEISRLSRELEEFRKLSNEKINTLTKQKGEVEIERDELKAKVTAEEDKVKQLTTARESLVKENTRVSDELRQKTSEITRLIQQNAELTRVNNKTVAVSSTQTTAPLNGKVKSSVVSAGRTLVEVDLGIRDGVKEGIRYTITRDGKLLANAVVEKVTSDASVAATTDAMNLSKPIMVGDLVTASAPQ